MEGMVDHEIFELSNGIRVVYKSINNSKIVHCGFVLDIGSRDERPEQWGIAHFWEHMAFKGTAKRKAFHIINRLESLGGEINAYTTKEKICFYASALTQHFEKSVELLTDITFFSTFPEKQIQNEKSVILEEMALYLDSPEDAIQDDFEDILFKGHSLGRNIIGSKESIISFERDDFRKFIEENLDNRRLVFSVVGDIGKKELFKIIRKYLETLPVKLSQRSREPITNYIARTQIYKKPIHQAHCAMGCHAYAIDDDRRLPFMMICNILGGPGLNSRLNLEIRERHGFVYAIDASYGSYTDAGVFTVYFATESKKMSRCIEMIIKELNKFKVKNLGTLQLHRAKEQYIGQMAMSEENNVNIMLMLAKSLLDLGTIETFEEVVQQIQQIKATDLSEIANDIFKDDKYSFLYFLPYQP
jgi:predicted Zn-dependent peptidase